MKPEYKKTNGTLYPSKLFGLEPLMKVRCLAITIFSLLVTTTTIMAAIHIQPYLQNPQPDGITVMWWTDSDEPNSSVHYGQVNLEDSTDASDQYISVMEMWLHEANLTGLETATEYDYKVVSGGDQSNIYTFKTAARRESDFHFAVLGDGRTDNGTVIARHRNIVNLAASYNPDLVFETGDMVYKGQSWHWIDFFRRIITASDPCDPGADLASRVPFHTAIGNHEIYTSGWNNGSLDYAMARYKSLFNHPANGSSNPYWEERYYTIKYACATFIVLDTNNDLSTSGYDNHDYLGDYETPPWAPGSQQYIWMVDQLAQAQSDSVFTFVLFHPSPYCRGAHGDPCEPQRGIEIRTLDTVFRQYAVDAVFTSHDHMVEHCLTGPDGFHVQMDLADPNNLNWFVQGNSGHTSRMAQTGWETWMDVLDNDAQPFYTLYFYSWAGDNTLSSFLDVDIAYKGYGLWQATFQTVRSDGQVYDVCAFQREDPIYTPKCGDRDHPYPIGDLSMDCNINLSDFALFAIQWDQTDCDPNDHCHGADLIVDGKVNLLDLAELVFRWLQCNDPELPSN